MCSECQRVRCLFAIAQDTLRVCLGQNDKAGPLQLLLGALQTILSACSTDCCLSQIQCKMHHYSFLGKGFFLKKKKKKSALGNCPNLSDLTNNKECSSPVCRILSPVSALLQLVLYCLVCHAGIPF